MAQTVSRCFARRRARGHQHLAGRASGPSNWRPPRQRQRIHAQHHECLRGASVEDCAEIEEGGQGARHAESFGPTSGRSISELPRGQQYCRRVHRLRSIQANFAAETAAIKRAADLATRGRGR
eukprot:7211359-Pyramimonas_sp.AAC.1